MIKLERKKDEKWIFQKNVSSRNIIKAFLEVVNQIRDTDNKHEIRKQLREINIYKGRSDEGSLNTMGVRMSQMCFYMFGYKSSSNIFMPAPTTLNMMKNGNDIEKNMLINLFSIQFPHPYSRTSSNFSIYAGRLITKLLTEKRINFRLYIDEFIWFLPFIKKIDDELYENLVESIIEYRSLSYDEKSILFYSVENCNDVFSNCMHECKYYFMKIFEEFGVFNMIIDRTHNDGNLFSFKHGNTNTYRRDNVQGKYSGYIELNPSLLSNAVCLLKKFSPFDKPVSLDDPEVFSNQEWITDLYEIEQLQYLEIVMPEIAEKRKIIESINNMQFCSKYGSVDGKDFENSLKPVFELFREVLHVGIISGAGDTDLLCMLQDDDSNIYKINVDGKSRTSSSNMNVKRILRHIEKHDSKYCIVVAPRFNRGTILDIKNEPIVAVTSETLAKYCSKECMSSTDYMADYIGLSKIIEKHYGEDISPKLEKYIDDKYGISL
ncbi:MAG: hypothetical protein ACOX1L_06910 [Erysipelotrichaceae bacterium]|jgi:CRISPR/Cas system CMR-associated protein Cmr5 small subunit